MIEDSLTDRPTLRELEALSAMIATRKTVAAAHALGCSQPAVSRAIASLEARMARTLFVRDGGRLQPTAEAFALEEEARGIFAALDRMGRTQQTRAGGVLRIAASPTLAQFLLPDMMRLWRERDAASTPLVEIGTNTAVVAAVADRVVDLGIADSPAPHPAVRAEALREAVAHCVMPEGHALAGRSSVSVADLGGEPVIALARRFPSRMEAERAFAAAGLHMRIVAEVSTSAFAVELVRRGIGIALVNPFPITLGGMAGLAARRFEPEIAYRTMLLFPALGAGSPAARAFADILKSEQPDDGFTHPIRDRTSA